MAPQADRQEPGDGSGASRALGDAGSERYMWAFRDGDNVVLSIPGLRDLEFNCEDARMIGNMLITTADEISGDQTI